MLRDPSGLLLLLIMPALLLLIMTYVQDTPFKDYQDIHFNVLVHDKDKGKISKQLLSSLDSSKNFTIHTTLDNKEVTTESFQQALQDGTYQVGIIIPEKITQIMVKASNKMADDVSQLAGIASMNASSNTPLDSAAIEIVFDPAVKPSMRTSISTALQQLLTNTKFDILLDRLNKLGGNLSEDSNSGGLNKELFNVLSVKEKTEGTGTIRNSRLNSVQHNVPAWAIFGMFMIVVPIAGNMLKEKNDGSDLRVRLIPNAYGRVMRGKVSFYITICTVQFIIMLLIGLYLIPILGLPKLYMGTQAWVIIPMILVIALTAVSFGVFIGSVFKTDNQAMPFGAITNVIFSALGGIWVPLDLMPQVMQKLAMISPLYWALQGINNIFLRDQGWEGIWFSSMILIIFSSILLMIAYHKKKSAQGTF